MALPLTRRRPHLPRTLRGRLVAMLVAVLIIGFAAATLVTVLGVRRVLIDRLDAQLQAAGDRFAVGLEHDDHDADNAPNRYGDVEGQAAGTLGARILNGRVTAAAIVGDHDTADRIPAEARQRLAGLGVDTTPRSIALPGIGTYRIIVAAGRDNDLQVTGLPAEPVEETIDRLVFIEAAVFGAALLVIAAASTGLVRLMLRPLSQMADTVAQVSRLPLHSGGVAVPHRVEVRTTGSEVGTLGTAFNAMLTEVESALARRDDSEAQLRRFIADASHELRTPVAVVRGHAELARRSTEPADVGHSLDRIIDQTARMGRLVDDLLLLARLDSGRPLASEPVDLTRIALDAVDDARATTPDHSWRLQLPTSPIGVTGDPHAVAQALANLLANAATHTPAGTTVTVAVRVADAGRVRVVVDDDGPGMPAELVRRAFDRFVRSESARSMTGGSSGLGLPIVAAIVAALGATIALDSGPAGTSVTIEFPGAISPGHDLSDGDPADGDPADGDPVDGDPQADDEPAITVAENDPDGSDPDAPRDRPQQVAPGG